MNAAWIRMGTYGFEGAAGGVSWESTMVNRFLSLVHPRRSMRVEQEKVELFHSRFEEALAESPQVGDLAACERRFILGHEELAEYRNAYEAGDLVAIADAIADQLYILLGTAAFHGIDIQPIFEEVHRSNMTKTLVKDSFKRATKGPGYEPPRIAELLLIQMHPEVK